MSQPEAIRQRIVPDARYGAGSFLARLSEDERAALLELGVERTIPAGSMLIFEHERERRMMLLLRGRVKITHVDRHGRELLLSIRDPGEVLGELSLIDREPRTATISALEGVTVVELGGEIFRSYLEATPRVAVVLLETVAGRFREELSRRLQFTETDTMGRLAARILELASRYGEPDGTHMLVAMPISLEELASWAGASRAGVAQALGQMRELGWIKTERKLLIVVDGDALRARAG